MSNDDDFYKNFNSSKSPKVGSMIFIPFICGILGAALVLGVVFGIPSIKNQFLNSDKTVTTSATEPTISNTNNQNAISLSNYSDTAIFAANKVLPSIVGIKVEFNVTSTLINRASQTASAEGSGIIISSDGYILTNNHIINSTDSSYFYEVSKATKVYVYLYNDSTAYEATIVGNDSQTDLAIIKVDKTGLTAAELGNSDSLKIGEFVLAIGNPLGMQSSVTSGIVSAINRDVTDSDGKVYNLVQTDAAINSGNSGGALVNSEGKVIGINTLKMSGSGIEGMGFAIPINNTIEVYKQLIQYGKVLRPYIGINGLDLNDVTANYYNIPIGVYVQSLDVSSPAEKAGVKVGDVIIGVDGNEITTMEQINKVKESKGIGDTITLKVSRNGEEIDINLTLEEEP